MAPDDNEPLPANIRITEQEMVELIRCSDRDHRLSTTWGAGDAWLLPKESNRWAFGALVELRCTLPSPEVEVIGALMAENVPLEDA